MVPRTNVEFWRAKLDRNRERDGETNRMLTAAGWSVMRFWEHEDLDVVLTRIETAVRVDP